MFFYFKRIEVHGVENVPKNKPILLLSNHQNALLDALLIATKCGRFSYFLTRAGVFKSTLISKILKSLRMLPVYRIRDGWGNLANNKAIFSSCVELFNKNEAIVIFPEGSHNLKRTVRPLSKGFTRIIFETLDTHPNIDLQLVPVGLNFLNAERFSDSTALYFGNPISAKKFLSDDRNKDVIALKTVMQSEISKLTAHIPTENYDKTLQKLEKFNVNFLKPEAVNKSIATNFEFYESRKKDSFSVVKKIFKLVLIIQLIVPYLIWKLIAKPKIKEKEFTSTFRFAIAITIVPLWLLIIALILAYNFGWLIALCFFTSVLLLTLLAVKL